MSCQWCMTAQLRWPITNQNTAKSTFFTRGVIATSCHRRDAKARLWIFKLARFHFSVCLSLAFFVRFPLATCTRTHLTSLVQHRRSLDVRRFPSLAVQSDGQLEFQLAPQLSSRRDGNDSGHGCLSGARSGSRCRSCPCAWAGRPKRRAKPPARLQEGLRARRDH